MMRWNRVALLLGCVALWGCAATEPELRALPRLSVPRAAVTPAVTAQADDPAWTRAAVIDRLQPCRGSEQPDALPNPTTVKILWDEQWLYVRFICRDDSLFTPHGPQADGKHHEGDVVEVFIDPVGDGRHYVEVQLNPVGGWMDVLHLNTTDRPPNRHWVMPHDERSTNHWGLMEWNLPGLRTASSIDRGGAGQGVTWIADMAIPAAPVLRRLARERFEPMAMRINFVRCDGPVDEATGKRARLIASCWALLPTGMPHLAPGTMGHLTLVD